jgi:magnesium-protoporphyrin IX monomethyl ester (oxidative) cyclase
MKILLINPPNTMDDVLGKASVFVSELDPLGLLYIAAVLEHDGHEVVVLDAFIDRLNLKSIMDEVGKVKPDVVGISCLTSNGAAVYEIGREIKHNFTNLKIVIGNVHASIFYETYLNHNCADAVVHGEGEYAFMNICRRYDEKKDLSGIPGVSWNNGKQIVNNDPPEIIYDLDGLPFPARHLIPREKYSVGKLNNFIYVNKGKKKIRQMFTSRGCVYSCAFCVVHKNRKYRTISPARVVDEMEHLVKEYDVGYVFIMDSLFIADKKRVQKICEEMVRRGVDIKWGCEGHVNIIDENMLGWMEKAGCYEIHFGIESGVQRLLDNVNKGTTLENIEKKVKMVKKVSGIKVSGLFMLGLPGETIEDTRTTIEYARRLPLDFAQFSITVPYPGSKLFETLSQEGKLDTGLRPDGNVDLDVWKRYSAHIGFSDNKPIYVPEGMSSDDLKKMEKHALRRFFLRPSKIVDQIKRIDLKNIDEVLKAAKAAFLEK